jgi:DNA-directed RNA polymerase specialized sigma24 family protein
LSREQVAKLLLDNEALLLRRIQGKLKAAGVRGYGLHPDDIFASVLRRIDLALVRRMIRTDCVPEFWAFVYRTTDNVAVARLRSCAREQSALDRWVARRLEQQAASEDAQAFVGVLCRSIASAADRELLRWRLDGRSYAQIACITGSSEAALRTRFAKILRKLRSRVAAQQRVGS